MNKKKKSGFVAYCWLTKKNKVLCKNLSKNQEATVGACRKGKFVVEHIER